VLDELDLATEARPVQVEELGPDVLALVVHDVIHFNPFQGRLDFVLEDKCGRSD